MRIGIVGAGAVGGYFGGRLAASGEDVTFIVRERTAAALREGGLRITSPNGDLTLPSVQVLAPGEAAEPFDLVLITVKMYDLAAAASRLASVVRPATEVVPLQNGVEAPTILAASLPGATVRGGVAYIAASLAGPGRVAHGSQFARILFGAADGSRPAPLMALEAASGKAGFEGLLTPDITLEVWRKFVFQAAFAAITCYARSAIGPIRDDPALWQRFAALLEEAVAVARAVGVALPADLARERLQFAQTLPPSMRSSMLGDLEAGQRLELDWLTGAVVRFADQTGTLVPVSRETTQAIAAGAAAEGAG